METTSLGAEDDIKHDIDSVTAICRGCLTTNRNMKSALSFGSLYKDLTGISITESDGLPQWLCYECSALLIKSVRFKCKMLKAHSVLYQYLTRCAPFGIDPHDEELSKYASPYLAQTNTLCCDVGKGKNGICQVLESLTTAPQALERLRNVNEMFKIRKVGARPPSRLKLLCKTIQSRDKRTFTNTMIRRLQALHDTHEKHTKSSALNDTPLVEWPKSEMDVKEEMDFSDYEDNITLEEFRSTANKISEDDIESLLRNTEPPVDDADVQMKKKRRGKKKTKEKKNKTSEGVKSDGETVTKGSIRKTITLDPQKIRIITLNPEEQIKQKEEEARTNLKFPFQCNLCHKGFNFEAKLANHMNKHSPSRGPFECQLCHMFLPTAYSFSVHSLIHTRRYECADCGRRMIDKCSIIDHYRTQHEGLLTLFTCDVCGKVSNNNKTHRGHMRNHHGADRPKCDQCGKTFVNKDSLAEHLQIHQGIKNYECSICGKKFRTRTQIKHHQLKHTDVKEFYCVECDVRFKSAHNLRQHLQKSLKHKDKGSFIYGCNSCEKRFEYMSALVAHTRVQHEGVRSHVCTACGAALASAASLAKHARSVHGGRRAPARHVCHTCGRAFRGKSVLTNHVRTHTGEKPFECTSCGRKFSQRTAMRTHVKLVHLKMRRQPKVKPELPAEQLPAAPKLEVFKPETPLEPWRQPCDIYFQVTVGP